MLPSPLLQAHIKSLRFDPEDFPVLEDIHLTVTPGQFILLLGQSDAGKSVLCRCLAGVIPSFEKACLEGTVYLSGKKTDEWRLADLAPFVSLVTDDPHNQLFCPTLEEDLAFGPVNLGYSALHVRQRVQEALEWVKLQGFETRRPETLSGGEAQRGVLASFITIGAPFLILDRAADQIDAQVRWDLYQTLAKRCRESGQSVIVIDELFQPLMSLADRIVVLEKGKVVYDGCPEGLPESRLEHFCRPPLTPFQGHPKITVNRNPQPILEVKNISYAYPSGDFALRDISLTVYPGECLCLLGPNGAGKTTLIRLLNGLLIGDRGEVLVDGLSTRKTPTAALADRIGMLFQDPESQLFADTVRKEVGFALRLQGLPKEEVHNRVETQLEELGLLPFADHHPYQLSRGLKQIVALAACLITHPPLIVLDEPLSHLGYPRNREILEFLAGLSPNGRTIILITHDHEAARALGTRLILMKGGRIISDSPNRPGIESVDADRA
jgi:energy-coupling factor transport system ATP-binding protein